MKIQTRAGVFETNSSSSHSLTLGCPSETMKQVACFADTVQASGEYFVECGEYGWSWERFYSLGNKLSYLATHCLSGGASYNDKFPTADVQHPRDFALEARKKNKKFDMLADVVEATFGVKLYMAPGTDMGYIDHESTYMADELFVSHEVLANFLLDPNAYIETGNDNSDIPETIDTDDGSSEGYFEPHYVVRVPADYVPLVLHCDWYSLYLDADCTTVLNPQQNKAVRGQGICWAIPEDEELKTGIKFGTKMIRNLGRTTHPSENEIQFMVPPSVEALF